MFFSILRIVFGFLLTLFIPGFALMLVLYPRRGDLGVVERIALSSVLSIAVTLLMALFLDLVLGVDFTAKNMVVSLSLFTVACSLVWFIGVKIRS